MKFFKNENVLIGILLLIEKSSDKFGFLNCLSYLSKNEIQIFKLSNVLEFIKEQCLNKLEINKMEELKKKKIIFCLQLMNILIYFILKKFIQIILKQKNVGKNQ
jgi:ABC-type lipoprotein export system ATPase subunit